MAAESMTISKVLDRREWSGQHGPMVTYKVELEGHGVAELNQKPSTPAPQAGESVFGELQPGREGFPPKLKKVQQNSFGGRGDSPEQRRSIERQVAAKIAADLVIGGKVEFKDFRVALDRVHAAIEGS